MEPTTPSSNQSLTVPIAIVFGFALIAIAIFFSNRGGDTAPNIPVNAKVVQDTQSQQMKPVTAEDHIRGNPNAPIVLVEYSDFDCPYCKAYHETMRQIMDEYGTTGEVAWVYRHFPQASLHPYAPVIAEASECVRELAGDDGNDAFWTFADRVFDERSIESQTNITRLDEFAVDAGVNGDEFTACMESERNRSKVEEDVMDGIVVGAQEGTPHTVVLVGGQRESISGAQPYTSIRNMIESLLRQINGAGAAVAQ